MAMKFYSGVDFNEDKGKNLKTPTDNLDAVNKKYIDDLIAGGLGDSIYVGDEPPIDPDINFWIDTDEGDYDPESGESTYIKILKSPIKLWELNVGAYIVPPNSTLYYSSIKHVD